MHIPCSCMEPWGPKHPAAAMSCAGRISIACEIATQLKLVTGPGKIWVELRVMRRGRHTSLHTMNKKLKVCPSGRYIRATQRCTSTLEDGSTVMTSTRPGILSGLRFPWPSATLHASMQAFTAHFGYFWMYGMMATLHPTANTFHRFPGGVQVPNM